MANQEKDRRPKKIPKYPNNLRQYMKARGLTVDQAISLLQKAAKKQGIAITLVPRTFGNYLRGDSSVPYQLQQLLANVFNCALEELCPIAREEERIKQQDEPCANSVVAVLPPQVRSGSSADEKVEVTDVQSETLPASVPPHMVQSMQVQQASGQDADIWSFPSSASRQILSLEEDIIDVASWFGARVSDINTLIADWNGHRTSYFQYQSLAYAEMEAWNNREHLSMTEEYLFSRRTALATLATVSASLIKNVYTGSFSASLLHEFFSQCVVSISACQQLLKCDGLRTVEHTLLTYLPLLEILARQPSRENKLAANLAAQGCLLAATISLHRYQIKKSEAYYRRAIQYSHIAEEGDLEVAAIKQLATRLLEDQRSDEAYELYQQALPVITKKPNNVSPRLAALIYLGIAAASASSTKKLEKNAEASLDQAKQIFTDHPFQQLPYVDLGVHHLYLWEGVSYRNIGNLEGAEAVFTQIDTNTQNASIPERVRLEIINQQADLALLQQNLDIFDYRFTQGALGAQSLQSQKRRQELIKIWYAARERWPREKRVLELAEKLLW